MTFTVTKDLCDRMQALLTWDCQNALASSCLCSAAAALTAGAAFRAYLHAGPVNPRGGVPLYDQNYRLPQTSVPPGWCATLQRAWWEL